ncbi:FG-GAP repeat protein [Candidatus Sumerlaeota bacterium]|nr:FG-GAP repeat protein [Candidatus Sumerlaeota bacterium]
MMRYLNFIASLSFFIQILAINPAKCSETVKITRDIELSESSGWYQKALTNISKMEYNVSWQETCAIPGGRSGYHITNRDQNLRAYFYSDKMVITSRDHKTDSWLWEWEPCQIQDAKHNSSSISTHHNILKYDRGVITECFENKPTGIKHTITISHIPHTSDFIILSQKIAGKGRLIKSGKRTIDFIDNDIPVIQYSGFLVKDAQGKKVNSSISIKNNIIEQEILSSKVKFPLIIERSITGFSSRINWLAESNQASSYFGHSHSTAGDVNGDGYDDIIVGSYYYQNCQNREGSVFVWYGSQTGLGNYGNPTNADWRAESDQEYANFGYCVSYAGDVNGDGYDDIIVGASYYSNGENNEGAVFVWTGSPTGLGNNGSIENAYWKAEGDFADAQFGYSVAAAGDVNGDGYDDIIVGAPHYGESESKKGRIYVYFGSGCGLSYNPYWMGEGNDSTRLGISVSGAGDVNGDGYDDIIAGADWYANGEQNEGGIFAWYGSAEGLGPQGSLNNADWKTESNKESAVFGLSVSCAGDINGDGFDDVIAGANRYGNDQAYEGRAYVYRGSQNGLVSIPAWVGEGNQTGSYFGISVGTVKDINKDGFDDIIVGAIGYDGKGAAFIYQGSATGVSGEAHWQAVNIRATGIFGIDVGTAGDVNGDGTPDVMISDTTYENGENMEGAVFVYYGPCADWIVEGDQALAQMGDSVSTAGDINGDGFFDVIIGAPGYDNGQTSEGRVFIFYGSDLGLDFTPAWIAESNVANAYLGDCVATAGDVNGDGFADILVGASHYGSGLVYEGAAFAWYGSASGLGASGIPANADWKVTGGQNYAYLGTSVDTAGDVNGDGYSDIIICAPEYANSETKEGAAFVWYGSAAGIGGDETPEGADWAMEGNEANIFFAQSASLAGDVNGDGFSDVIIGSPFYGNGRAYAYYGSPSGLSESQNWMGESDIGASSFGRSVSTAGDVNGDGFADVIIGAPYYGMGAAFVFHGSGSGLSATADWEINSGQSNIDFGGSVKTAGDVNGDGFSDIIIGAPQYKYANQEEGIALIFYGSNQGLKEPASPLTPDILLKSNQYNSLFGKSVAPAGDVNGDGFSDVIIGAPGFTANLLSEGAAFVFYGSGGKLGGAPNWYKEGTQDNSYFGVCVNSAGDINGDGYADIIIGAERYDNGEIGEGAAFAYLGSQSGMNSIYDWMAEGDQTESGFGRAVSSAGDVNGDGYDDIIIGAYNYNNGVTPTGRAFVWHGATSGLGDYGTPANADWSANIDKEQSNFGLSVDTAGDVNGDGYSDIIVGAFGYSNGESTEGAAFVWHGSGSGLGDNGNILNADWMAESDCLGARFGRSVSTAGDINRDGFSDVIIGAEYYQNGESNEGGAFVFYGAHNGLSSVPNWKMESNQPVVSLGESVSAAGDVNGDGCSDIIITAPFYQLDSTTYGTVFVWYGSPAGLDPDSRPENADWSSGLYKQGYFGRSVSSAGDINGDGYSDIIIGQMDYSNGENREGRALAYLGSSKGLQSLPCWIVEGDSVSAYLGTSVAGAGDINGDGLSDIIIGAYTYNNGTYAVGKALVFHGNQDQGLAFYPRQKRLSDNTPISHLGLSDNENSFRLLLNAPTTPCGRGKVKLECDVLPLDTLLIGEETKMSPDWTQTYTTSTLALECAINGLEPGPAYHWQMRLRYDPVSSPFQYYSRWINIPWGGIQEAALRTGPSAFKVTFEELKAYLLGKILFTPTYKTAADFNQDGKLDSADLLYFLK